MGNTHSRQKAGNSQRPEKTDDETVAKAVLLGWRPDKKDSTLAGFMGDIKERIPGPDPTATIKSARELTEEEKATAVVRYLIFWRNGFQIYIPPECNGGGEFIGMLMPYEDPSSMKILHEINSGSAPLDFVKIQPGQATELRVHKRVSEDLPSELQDLPSIFTGASNDGQHDNSGISNYYKRLGCAPLGKGEWERSGNS